MFQPPASSPPVPVSISSQKMQPGSVGLRLFAACFTSMMISVSYTNYSPLVETMKGELGISGGQAGLFSTMLFLGLAVTYLPAGMLVDRYGARPVLTGSTIVLALGEIMLPMVPNLTWLLACRLLVGLGTGAAFVTGAGVAAGLGKHASLGQGLYGGSTQIGTGMGLLLTPLFLHLAGWRGAFLIWGLLSVSCVIVWFFVHDEQSQHTRRKIDLKAALRSRSVWTLGLSHLGTFGLGNAIAAWITIYLVLQYGLPLATAATIGSVVLLSGMFFRPLGGLLIARNIIGSIPLLRAGTIMGSIGVALLALPLRMPLLAVVGLSLLAIGSTIPFISVFNPAANLRGVGKGVAQGLISIISCPTVIIGPPLIGLLLDRTGNFSWAFASILLFGCVSIVASFLAGPAVRQELLT